MISRTQVTRGSDVGVDNFTPSNELEKFYSTVGGRTNILHDYNLYNYNWTIVSLSKQQIENPDSYKGKVFQSNQEGAEFYIVARSGGYKRNNSIAGGTTQSLASDSDEGYAAKTSDDRDKDLYIENVRFETRVGINNVGSSNLTKGTFNVIEPYSSTEFYRQLFNAARFAGHVNYIGAPFLLVLSFYGRKIGQNEGEPEIVPKATRYIPVLITKSDMNVNEGGANYNVEFIGANQQASSPIYATTKSDIDGPTPTSTGNSRQEEFQKVAVVLNDFFKKHNESSKEFYRKLWERANEGNSNTVATAVADRLSSNRANANRAAATQRVPVLTPGAVTNAHKYCIWFSNEYDRVSGQDAQDDARTNQYSTASTGTPFPSNLANLTYSDWTGKADQVLRSGQLTAPFTNTIATSPMINGNLPRTGGRNVTDVTQAVERLDADITNERQKLSQARGQIQTLRGQLQGELQAIGAKLEALAPEATPDDMNQDLLASTSERVDSNALVTSFESFTAAATDIKNRIGPNVPRQEIVALEQLIAQANAKIGDLANASSAEIRAQSQLQSLEENRRNELNQPRNFYSGQINWAWRQGINVQKVIETVILESDYSASLARPETYERIRSSEYVKWFRVEIFAKPIGFDPFTMDFQYEFHYVVQPYDIHYSKLPGLNIQFSTNNLKKLAVREYNYIYTGKNVDVLDFNLNYNNLFFVPLVFSPPEEKQTATSEEAGNASHVHLSKDAYPKTLDELVKQLEKQLEVGQGRTQPMLRSNRPTHRRGEPAYPNEVALAFQDFLYNPPADQALIRARIKVVGDPVYIIGSGITHRPRLLINDVVTSEGEMNSFSREVDIVFKFQTINDIPSNSELLRDQFQSKPNINRYNGVYQVVAVTNFFEDGQFSQELECLRRPNQETDFESPPQMYVSSYEESAVESGVTTNPDARGQDGRSDAKPNVEPSGSVTDALEVMPSAPANSAISRLVQNISTQTGLSETQVRQRIGQEVLDNRARTGFDASGRGAEATTSEVVKAAVAEFPSQLPNVPNTPEGIAQVVSLFNSPLPTQDQLRQNVSTPGEARNLLDLINMVAGGSPNPYAPPRSSGSGSIVLNPGARRYWGNVPRDEKVRITDLAGQVNYPLRLNSSQRPELYNAEVGGATGSYHRTGQAFDVSTEGWSYQQTEDFIRRASQAGYNGIDVGSNYIHIDTRPTRWGRLQSGGDPRLADTIDQHEDAPLVPLNLPGGGS